MGAEYYEHFRRGTDPKALFEQLTEEEREEYGTDAYSGSIATKTEFVIREGGLSLPLHIAKSYAADDVENADKWGPSFALAICEMNAGHEKEIIGYLFYGISPS